MSKLTNLYVLLFFALASSAIAQETKSQSDVTIIQGVIEKDTVGDQRSDEKKPATTKTNKRKKSKKHTTMDHFMRVKRSKKRKPVAFETSVTRYVTKNEDGKDVYVDLIGVVHIGEQSYYEELNRIFENYDSVLYELVAPEGMVPERNARAEGFNPVASLQMGMQSVLGLEFQLDHIQYKKDNFVHADMSPSEFLESMKQNDESFGKIALKAFGQSLAQSNSSSVSNFDLLRVAFAKDKEIKMRQLFATQMIDMEAGMQIFEGREGSTIINHRNGKAMEVLSDEIDKGEQKIAIFYGAGHLPDMERRLMSDFRMKRAGQYWLEAWKLKR